MSSLGVKSRSAKSGNEEGVAPYPLIHHTPGALTFSTLRNAALAFALGMAFPAAAQSPTVLTVTSPADDANARDANPGDGECVDTFTDANPSAEPRCTLRAAVDEANALGGDVVINLPGQLPGGESGSYTLTRTAPDDADNTYEDANAYGDLDLDNGGSITIRGTGTPGPTVTIAPNDRVFHLLSGTVRIERTEITGGTARAGANGISDPGEGEVVDGSDGDDGGCVLVAAGVTATLDQVSINNCATQSGGNGAAPAAADTPGGNAGNGGDGGGVANYGTLTVTRSFVFGNGTGDAGSAANGTAGTGAPVAGGNGGNGGNGGGIFTAGTLTVEETTLIDNTGGDPSQGAAGTNGGAGGYDGEGGSGGGIAALDGASVTLRNTIVARNAAGDDVNNPETGGDPSDSKQPGSDLFDGTPADDDTVSPDFPPYTPGVFTDGGNNLVGSNNSVEDVFPDVASGTAVDQNGSIVGSGQGDAPTRVAPGVTGTNQNETYTVTAVELAPDSPAVDAGANTDLDGNEIQVDGRGFRRPGTASGDDTVDIGGFELDSEPVMGQLVINELDSVTAPSGENDRAEFVEIKNTGSFEAQLADYALVLYSGEDDAAYASYNLSGALAPGATVVVGDPDAADGAQELFTGAPDDVRDEDGAVGLYLGKASDYPVGAVAGQNASTRVDVLVYDNGTQASRRMDASTLAAAFGQSEDDVASGDTDGASIQRNDDGSYAAGPPTPGEETGGGGSGSVPEIAFENVQTGAREDAGTATLTLVLTDLPAEDATATVTLVSGDPADLGGFTSETVDLSSDIGSETTYTVTVPITDDAEDEPNESFTFALSVNGGSGDPVIRLGARQQTVLVVTDDDGASATATVPIRDADGDGVEDGGYRFLSLPLGGVSADALADAAGGDVLTYDPTTQTYVPVGAGTTLDAGQPVVVEVAPGAEITLDGTAASGDVSAPTLSISGEGDARRVLAAVGNPTDRALPVDSIRVDGGVLASTALVLDPETGGFRPVSVDDGAVLPPFESAIIQVVPDGDADVTVTVPDDVPAGDGPALTDLPSGDDAALVVTISGDAGGDTAVLRFDGDPGADPDDAIDVTSASGVTLSFFIGDVRIAQLAQDDDLSAAPVTLPLQVDVPAGDYTVDLTPTAFEVGGQAVDVELLDDGQPVALDADGAVTLSIAADDADRFALRLTVQDPTADADGPAAASVSRVFPNPTAGRSAIEVDVVEAEAVRVAVYDVLGRQVALVHDGPLAGGTSTRLVLGGRRLAPGAYVVRVDGETFSATRRLTVTR